MTKKEAFFPTVCPRPVAVCVFGVSSLVNNVFRSPHLLVEIPVFPLKRSVLSRKSQKTLYIVTRKSQFGNTEFSIEEGYGKDCL